MMSVLLSWIALQIFGKVPAVFEYSSTKMMGAAITTVIISILIGPYCIKKLYEMKIGQAVSRLSDVPSLAKLHEKKNDTPTMGGILIGGSSIFAAILWMDLSHPYTIAILSCLLLFGCIGAYDDLLKLKKRAIQGLSSKGKFALQIAIALGLTLTYLAFHGWEKVSFYLPFSKYPVVICEGWGLVLFVFTSLFVIVGASNAVNLTDGLDGLAAGVSMMVTAVFALLAFLSSNAHIAEYLHLEHIVGAEQFAIFLSGLFGSLIGFLWYNAYPAQVFMGDTGSLPIGAVLGVSAVYLRKELLLAIAGIIFVAEALSVIIQILSYRYRNKKRVFLCAPLHHHYEYQGIHETKVVIRFWIISLLFSIIALLSLKFQ